MQNQLGFFFNAWRPRLAFLYAGVQGPLPVFRLLVTRCIFQCFCVYLFQCFIIPKGSDARSMIIFVAPALSVPDCASWSGLPLWLDFYCGRSPSPGTNLSVHGFGPRLGAPWRILGFLGGRLSGALSHIQRRKPTGRHFVSEGALTLFILRMYIFLFIYFLGMPKLCRYAKTFSATERYVLQ